MTMDLTAVVGNIEDAGNIIPAQPKRKEKGNATSGRRRFAEEICSIHGKGEYGDPCAKFAHLPGNGRGVYQPGVIKSLLVVLRVLIKPLAICGTLGIGGFLLLFWFSNILQHHSFVPGSTGGVPNSHGSTPRDSVRYCRIVRDVIPVGCKPGDKVIRVAK